MHTAVPELIEKSHEVKPVLLVQLSYRGIIISAKAIRPNLIFR